ncbi:hypothetical protein MRX96_000058 [Rhipicephalus microplus]
MSEPPQGTSDRPQSQGASDAVGDRFAFFAALEEKMEKFSTANSVQLWKRDARTIETAKSAWERSRPGCPPELKYYHLRYCCIHGGTKFVISSKGVRKASTFKKDCGFNIYIAANKDGSHLEARSLNLEHNHAVVPELFKHLPQQRRLPSELQDKARALLKLKANKILQNEKMHKAALMLQKQRVVTNGDEATKLYLKLLTPYAYNCVKEELDAAAVMTSIDALANANKFFATAQECTCAFRQVMQLPCRHIFAVRDNLNISKFNKAICAGRWFLNIYVQSCGLADNSEHDVDNLPQVSSRKDEKVLSSHQKFKKAASIASKLADLALDCSTARFKERLKVLESILQPWKDGAEVAVSVLTPSERRERTDSPLNASEHLPSTGAMVEDLPLQKKQPLSNIQTPCARCTFSEVDLQSTCPLDMESQAAGGEALEDYAELSASNDKKVWTTKRPHGYRLLATKETQEGTH